MNERTDNLKIWLNLGPKSWTKGHFPPQQARFSEWHRRRIYKAYLLQLISQLNSTQLLRVTLDLQAKENSYKMRIAME